MPFIYNVIQGGQSLGKLIAASSMVAAFLDETRHPEKYYKDRDIQIIEAARLAYREVFKDEPLPVSLQYYHETLNADDLKLLRGDKPTEGRQQPPRSLDKEHIFTCMTVGTNIVGTICGNAVLKIHNYLNALNKDADKITDRAVHNYGHHNDSIRFLFCLVAGAFIELSSLDVNDIDGLKEAQNYITFLDKLTLSHTVTHAMNDITAVNVDMGLGKFSTETPLSMIVFACQEFRRVIDIILYQRSRSSVSNRLSYKTSCSD